MTTINEITEGNDGVFRLRIDGLEKSGQGDRTSMNVADCYRSSRHRVPRKTGKSDCRLESLAFLPHDEGPMEPAFLQQDRRLFGSSFATRGQNEKRRKCSQDAPIRGVTPEVFQNSFRVL